MKLFRWLPVATSSILVVVLAMFVVACQQQAAPPTPEPAPAIEKEAEVWTCPMHPEIQEPAPGKCPICNMDLVLEQGDSDNSDQSAGLTNPDSGRGRA